MQMKWDQTGTLFALFLRFAMAVRISSSVATLELQLQNQTNK